LGSTLMFLLLEVLSLVHQSLILDLDLDLDLQLAILLNFKIPLKLSKRGTL